MIGSLAAYGYGGEAREGPYWAIVALVAVVVVAAGSWFLIHRRRLVHPGGAEPAFALRVRALPEARRGSNSA